MGDRMMRINELILAPLITIFFLCLGQFDVIGLLSSAISVVRGWSEWTRYWRSRFDVQAMYLETMRMGGPFISTNDPDYLPYVFADAVVRHDTLRQGSAKVLPVAEPWTHTQ
jgi:hypothetical protein